MKTKTALYLMALPLALAPVAAQARVDASAQAKILNHLEKLEEEMSALRAELKQMSADQVAHQQTDAAVQQSVAAVEQKEAAHIQVEAAHQQKADAYFDRAATEVHSRPVNSWTGVYGGVQVGWANGNNTDALNCGDGIVGSVSTLAGSGLAQACTGNIIAVGGFAPGSSWESSPGIGNTSGFTGGLRFGYNRQIKNFVVGGETSFTLSGSKGAGYTLIDVSGFGGGEYYVSHKVNWYSRTVLKGGYLVTPRLLTSVNAGIAFASTSLTSSAGYTASNVSSGWTVGAEAEYRLTDAIGLTASYNYKRFNGVTYEGASLASLIDNFHRYNLELNSVDVGVNYHF